MNGFITLLKYNFSSEYRRVSQSMALVLFAWIVCYIIFKVHPDLENVEFGFLYWIFMMLISINICIRAESHHGTAEHIFLYTCIDPSTVFSAKFVFNFLYLILLGFLFYFFFIIYFGHQIAFNLSFLSVIAIGAFAISACLSFVATMSSYADGQNTLISILALPLLIPVILILKSTTDEIILFDNVEFANYLTLISISFATIALSIVLFPIIWKE